MTVLLERDDALARLAAALERVWSTGVGEIAAVRAEAGGGKTALLRELARRRADTEVLWGACDGLRTPRPLGPLLDIAVAAGGDLASKAATADLARDAIFAELVRRLSTATHPVLVVVEDLHWADDATLDFLTFLGRRATATRALIVLSYRDDEVGGSHPLRVVLGDLAAATRERIQLPSLSVDAVSSLADGTGIDATSLHAITGGNPFFVSESIASGTAEVPDSVRDAVLARAGRLRAPARRALEAVAVVPGRAELWLVDVVAGPDVAALDECVDRGVVAIDGEHAALRHELARLAIVDAIAPNRRRGLHQRVLSALTERGVSDHGRLTYHAAEAGDVDAVVRYGPSAAQQAAAAGSHRQAAQHLSDVLQHGELLSSRDRAPLLVQLAGELYNVGRYAEAIDAYDRGIELARELDDRRLEGRLLARRAGPLLMSARSLEATATSRAAVDLLDDDGPSVELAEAYSALGSQMMLARQLGESIVLLDRAEALAEEVGDEHVVSHARIQAGVAQLMAGDDAGLARIHAGIDAAQRLGRDDRVALGWSQIGSGAGEIRRYDLAVPALRRCVEFSRERDQVSGEVYSLAWLARCELDLGHWDDAGRRASSLLTNARATGVVRFVALLTLGRLRARRGDPDVWTALDESLALARQSAHLQRLWPIAAARAEAAWLAGRLDEEIGLVDEVHAMAADLAYPWAVDELAFWQWRSGREAAERPDGADTPFRLHLSGRVLEAAAAWLRIGCPYEEADALADSDAADDVRRALSTFDALGATPAAARTVRRLRAMGEHVARGPNRATRSNPAGLTDREVEVLSLVAAGLSNQELGRRLGISVKTAGHHVSHVLAKLGAANRAEAAAAAARMGIAALDT